MQERSLVSFPLYHTKRYQVSIRYSIPATCVCVCVCVCVTERESVCVCVCVPRALTFTNSVF